MNRSNFVHGAELSDPDGLAKEAGADAALQVEVQVEAQ